MIWGGTGSSALQKNNLTFGGSDRRKFSVSLSSEIRRLEWDLAIEGNPNAMDELEQAVEIYLLKFNIPADISRLMMKIRGKLSNLARSKYDFPDQFIEAIPVGANLGYFKYRFISALFRAPGIGLLHDNRSIEYFIQKLISMDEYYYLMATMDGSSEDVEKIRACEGLKAKFSGDPRLLELYCVQMITHQHRIKNAELITERALVLKGLLLSTLKQQLVQTTTAIRLG